MTLATCFRFQDGAPFLLGDALISSDGDSSNVNLPTNSGLVFEKQYEGVLLPSGLKQKTIVLSDHLAFGWSGNWAECAALIRETSEEFGTDEVKGDDVASFLDSKTSEYPNANLVGISKFEDYHYVLYFNGVLKCAHPQLKDFYAIGSGASYFSALARENEFPISGDHREYVCAIAGMIGGMLGQEMVNQAPLLSNFGGAFELVHYYSDNSFKKLEHATYFYWSANQSTNGLIYVIGLPIIIKYVNDGKCSLVIRLTGNRDECKTEGRIPNFQTEYFRLNPVIGISSQSQWEALETADFNSPFQCHYVFGKMQDGREFARCLAMFGGHHNKIAVDGCDLVLTEIDETTQIIADEIKKFYK